MASQPPNVFYSIAVDSKVTVYVSDRENNRIPIFDPTGARHRTFSLLLKTTCGLSRTGTISRTSPYDTLAGRIDLGAGKILGAMESPGHWLNVSSTSEIYIGSLTGNVFRWYPGWLSQGLGSQEGLRPAN